MLWLWVNDKKTPIRTMISHGRKDYTGNLWLALKKQLKLSDEQLMEFLECKMDGDGYVVELESGGHI